MSNLHVVFGAGPLGRSVVNELVRRGQTVRVVSRSGLMAEAPQGVELVSGDLYNPSVVRELTQGAAVAYQCAQPHYWEWPQKFPPLQAAIIEGLTGTGTKLVIGENTYMVGDTDGKPLTEDLPYAAHTRKGKVRAAMSEAALAAHKAGKVQVATGPRLRLLRAVGAGLVARRPRLLPRAGRQSRPASAASWTCRTRPPTSRTSAGRWSSWASATRRWARPGTSPTIGRRSRSASSPSWSSPNWASPPKSAPWARPCCAWAASSSLRRASRWR